MLLTLMGYEQTYEILYGFSQRYWQATHPAERTEMAAGVFSDIAIKGSRKNNFTF